MLPVLNLSALNLLHYYENRDDGIYHVFRNMGANDEALERITEATRFKRDLALLNDLPTIAVKQEHFTHGDAKRIKEIFPDIKMSYLDAASVTYDAKTVTIAKKTYQTRNTESYFNRDGTLPLSFYDSDIIRMIADKVNYDYDLRSAVLDRIDAAIPEAVDRFNKGELSNDTWPIWQVFFDYEKKFLRNRDVRSPAWKPFFDKLDQSLELRMHPGTHRLYTVTSPINEITSVIAEKSVILPLTHSLDAPYIDNKVTDTGFYGLDRQHDISPLTFDQTVLLAKGIIEINRDTTTGISMLAKTSDIPIAERVRFVDFISESVAANAHRARQAKSMIDNIISTFKKKPSQQSLNNELMTTYFGINKIFSAPSLWTFNKLGNLQLSKWAGIDSDLNRLHDAVMTRHERVQRVFGRNMRRTRDIADIDDRKVAITAIINDYIDNARGMSIVVDSGVSVSNNNSNNSNNIDMMNNERNKLKDSFEDIDQLKDFNKIRILFADAAGNTIDDTLQDYQEARQQHTEKTIRQQQNAARNDIQHSTTASVNNDNESLPSKVIHEDVGEKIGGAKKDLYNHITSKNIDQLTFDEKVKYALKSKIWPKPDWTTLIASGVKRSDIYFIKLIRDAIEPTAQKLSTKYYGNKQRIPLANSDSDYKYWLAAIEYIRDEVAAIKSSDDFQEAIGKIDEFLRSPVDDAHKSPEDYRIDDSTNNEHALGNSFRKFLYRRDTLESTYRIHKVQYQSKNDDFFDKKLGTTQKEEQTPTADDNTETQTKVSLKTPVPEHLKHLTRSGIDWRKGMDVTGEQIADTFGFRGIEYGNWVSQKERQLIINHCYDAFMDLAYVIGLPQDKLHMISLNGTLALGFGSRGNGKALAHYEPLRIVINITKIKGAGSMAHEWFHALDHYLGEITGLSHAREKLFSEIISVHGSSSNPNSAQYKISRITDETIAKMAAELTKTLSLAISKPREQEHIDADIANSYRSATNQLGSWAISIARDYIKKSDNPSLTITHNPEKITELLKEVGFEQNNTISGTDITVKIATMMVLSANLSDKLAKTEIANGVSEKDAITSARLLVRSMTAVQVKEKAILESPDNIQRIKDMETSMLPFIIAERRCRKETQTGVDWLRHKIETANKSTTPAETNYFLSAKQLDGKGKHYWQKPCELLARAFSVAVYEKLLAEGMQSDYLVRGASRNEFADTTIYKGNSNPEGKERDVLNECFDNLLTSVAYHAQSLPEIENNEEMRM